MAFPVSPANGDFYKNFKYNSTTEAWEKANGWHNLTESEKHDEWNPNGLDISSSSWFRVDYSTKVPSSATWLNLTIHCGSLGGSNAGLLNTKLPSETYAPGSANDTHPECELIRITEGLSYNVQVPCENGQFDICEYNSLYSITAIHIHLKAFYIGG